MSKDKDKIRRKIAWGMINTKDLKSDINCSDELCIFISRRTICTYNTDRQN